MTDRPTPETDSLHEKRMSRDVMSQYFEMVDLSRRLERESDDARDDHRFLLREIFNLTQIGDPHPADLPMKALKAIAEMIDEQWKVQSK